MNSSAVILVLPVVPWCSDSALGIDTAGLARNPFGLRCVYRHGAVGVAEEVEEVGAGTRLVHAVNRKSPTG